MTTTSAFPLSLRAYVRATGLRALASEVPTGPLAALTVTETITPVSGQRTYMLHTDPACEHWGTVQHLAPSALDPQLAVVLCLGCTRDPDRQPTSNRDRVRHVWNLAAAAAGSVTAADILLTELETAAAPGGSWSRRAWSDTDRDDLREHWAPRVLHCSRLIGTHPGQPVVAQTHADATLEEFTTTLSSLEGAEVTFGDPLDEADLATLRTVQAWAHTQRAALADRWVCVAAAWPGHRLITTADERWLDPVLVAVYLSAGARAGFTASVPDDAGPYATLVTTPVVARTDKMVLLRVLQPAASVLKGLVTQHFEAPDVDVDKATGQVALTMLENRPADAPSWQRLTLARALEAAVEATA